MPDGQIIDLTELSSGEEDEEDEEEGRNSSGDSENSDSDESSGAPPVPINAASRAMLEAAIMTASTTVLQEAILDVLRGNPACEELLMRKFVTTIRGTQAVAARFEVCQNCEQPYDVGTRRRSRECRYHPGDLELDEENGFADWDEDCHGPMDTKANRAAYPENFLWSCCDGDGSTVGCEKASHTPSTSKKRKRL